MWKRLGCLSSSIGYNSLARRTGPGWIRSRTELGFLTAATGNATRAICIAISYLFSMVGRRHARDVGADLEYHATLGSTVAMAYGR